MKIKPSEKTQRAWVNKYLNGGICPRNQDEWYYELMGHDTACYDALEWMSEAEVYSLADAWRLCPKPDWLMWALERMQPTKKEAEICIRFMESFLDKAEAFPGARKRNMREVREDSFAVASLDEFYNDIGPANDRSSAKECLSACNTLHHELEESLQVLSQDCDANVFTHAKYKKFEQAMADELRAALGKNPWEF